MKDLIPNCNLGNDLTKEDIEWFFSKEIALFMSYVGAAGCVTVIEDVFAMGLEKLIVFG